MTTEELVEQINDWQSRAGESFVDYYMHDNVDDKEWGQFLIDKGFVERGQAIIDVVNACNAAKTYVCQDQEFLYHPNYNPDFVEDRGWNGVLDYSVVYDDDSSETDENYDKDVELWAEFLIVKPLYLESVIKFLEE